MCLNLCYFGLWTPKWRKILPGGSAGSVRAAALAGSCPGRHSAARPRTAGSSHPSASTGTAGTGNTPTKLTPEPAER